MWHKLVAFQTATWLSFSPWGMRSGSTALGARTTRTWWWLVSEPMPSTLTRCGSWCTGQTPTCTTSIVLWCPKTTTLPPFLRPCPLCRSTDLRACPSTGWHSKWTRDDLDPQGCSLAGWAIRSVTLLMQVLPPCSKGFFSKSQLSAQAVLWCLYSTGV